MRLRRLLAVAALAGATACTSSTARVADVATGVQSAGAAPLEADVEPTTLAPGTPAVPSTTGSPTTTAAPAPRTPQPAADGAYGPFCPLCPRIAATPARPLQGAPALDGTPPVVSKLNTTEPVVFVTIDDGQFADPKAAELLAASRIPVSLFLTEKFITQTTPWLHTFTDTGQAWVNSHTTNHPLLPNAGNPPKEICGPLAHYEREFGGVGRLFRPPGGNWNPGTQKAAATCGMQAIVLWKHTSNNGEIQHQGGRPLEAGDIVLMHFRPDLGDNLEELFRQINERGLRVGRLECYLGGDPRCGTAEPWQRA